MPELSDEARGMLRDFILVFDLDDYFKGSTVISNDEAAQVLHYIQSLFEVAGIPAPTTNMTDKALAIRSKALRGGNKFKKEHAKFHELIKFAFELCHVNTADGFLPAIAEASVRKPPSYWFPKGRKNLNEKLLKERIEMLEKSLAEQEALVAKMTSLREAARKLGCTVVGGTSSEHAIKEDYKLVKAKLADAKELVEELKPKADKEGKSHTFDAVYMYFMRRLVNDCSIPPERLCQVVHYVYAALFHKGYAGKVPSAQCVRDWIDDLSCKDMELLTELVKNVSKTRSVHILADSSKRDVERHSIHVTYWDDERDQPVTLMVGLPVVVDASSAALAKLTLTTLLTAGVNFEWSMGSPFSSAFTTDGASAAIKEQRDLWSLADAMANLVWDAMAGSQKLTRHRIEATCDLHALSRALVNGSTAAFGVKGDMKHMHVLQLGYKVAYACNLNWTKYAALLQLIFGEQVQKPQMLVETRWGYVLKNMRWLLQYGVEQEKLFECSQRMVQALESSAVERGIWDEIGLWILKPEIRVQIQFLAEFGDVFMDAELAWSEAADNEYALDAGYRFFRMPLRAAQREVALEQMLADVERALPKTFAAIQTEFAKAATAMAGETTLESFSAAMKNEVLEFLRAFKETMSKNSAERVWKPAVLWGCLAEQSVQKDVADILLRLVFEQPVDPQFQPSELADATEQAAWKLLKVKLENNASAMRDVWTDGWRISDDDTLGYIAELSEVRAGRASLHQSRIASLANTAERLQKRGNSQKTVSMPLWLRLFKSVFFSIRHHTQNVETSFKHVDDLKIVSTNLSAQHLEDRVLDRVNNIMRDLEAARKQHVPVAGRMKPKPTDGKAASRGRQILLRTSANCLFIARQALATCAQHYTFESMAAIRKKCRPKQAKRKRADDGKPYLAEHNRKTEHWSGRERTQSRDTLQHKAVAIVMTKKLKEDTDVEQLHTNAVKVVFKERKLDHVYHFMDTTTHERVCASSTTQPAFMELVQDRLDANDQSGEVRQQCIEQHKKDAEAKANAKSAKHAAAMAAMVTNTDAT